jgi:catechol 2,3-dioxygenase-like lactoylglutathione lyase family enzyme
VRAAGRNRQTLLLKEQAMKRLHVHIAVDDLEKSIGFYSTLFAAPPSVRKDDYAKWMLDDPRVNLAISQRAGRGVDHLGIQTETDSELRELAGRLKAAGETTRDQEATTCCYAQSNKAWVDDPSGVRWETFFTFGEATTYGEDEPVAPKAESACCAPKTEACCA